MAHEFGLVAHALPKSFRQHQSYGLFSKGRGKQLVAKMAAERRTQLGHAVSELQLLFHRNLDRRPRTGSQDSIIKEVLHLSPTSPLDTLDAQVVSINGEHSFVHKQQPLISVVVAAFQTVLYGRLDR